MKRSPAVANQFYPGSYSELYKTISDLTPKSTSAKQDGILAISPHAGYIYSGGVAAETLARVKIPDTVIVLGPNHRGAGDTVAVMDSGQWDMPFGPVDINEELSASILNNSKVFRANAEAHLQEHSLEVQVPFLQYHNNNITLVPICLSFISYDDCLLAGQELAAAIRRFNRPVLMVASTDMTHYESRKSATGKDQLAMQQINNLDPKGLYNTVISKRISMCGIIPTTVALIAALELGAQRAELVRYTDSGEKSGDTHQVVGYAGYVVS